MSAGVRLNDEGTIFQMTIRDEDGSVVDISGASTKQLNFLPPDGVNKVMDAAFVTDGTDGKMKYVAADGFVDEVGLWRWQGYVELASGKKKTDIHSFRVHDNI